MLKTKSRLLLEKLCTPFGIQASLSDEGNYRAVFTRDAVMAGIAGILYQNEIIIDAFARSLMNLKATQKINGQIASNFKFNNESITHVSYGTLSPKIDSCTLYLIGVALQIREGVFEKKDWFESVQKTITLLESIEYNGRDLIYIPKGGNWADEYPYDGYLLYDQSLRLWALQLCGKIFGMKEWNEKAVKIKLAIESNYIINEENKGKGKKYHPIAYDRISSQSFPFYISGFSPTGYSKIFDLPANAFTSLVIQPDFNEELFGWINKTFFNHDSLPWVFYPAIEKTDNNWDEISNFYLYVFKNQPHHYHNGGIWWIWLGWLSLSLAKNGKTEMVNKLYEVSLNKIDKIPDFGFEEYIDSAEFRAGGTKNMAFTATGILFMDAANNNISKLEIFNI